MDFAVASALLGISEPELLREAFVKREVLRLQPGMAVQLRRSKRRGVAVEFYLGRWRVLWEDSTEDSTEMFCSEEELEILDEGLRPKSCCQKCWALAKQLTSEGSSLALDSASFVLFF